MLKQLGKQGERIEHLSKEEHELVKELHPQVEQIQQNVEQIVDAVQPARDPSRMPLFQANFRLQGTESPELHLEGLEAGPSTLIDNHTSKFDLALELPAVPESAGYLEYSTSLFKPESADKMAEDIQVLLRALLSKSGEPINKIAEVIGVKAGVRGKRNGR